MSSFAIVVRVITVIVIVIIVISVVILIAVDVVILIVVVVVIISFAPLRFPLSSSCLRSSLSPLAMMLSFFLSFMHSWFCSKKCSFVVVTFSCPLKEAFSNDNGSLPYFDDCFDTLAPMLILCFFYLSQVMSADNKQIVSM